LRGLKVDTAQSCALNRLDGRRPLRQGVGVVSRLRRSLLIPIPLWLIAGFTTLGWALLAWPIARAVDARNAWALYLIGIAFGVVGAVVTAIEFNWRVVSRTPDSVTLEYRFRSSGLVPFTKGRAAVLVGAFLLLPGIVGAAFPRWSNLVVAGVTVVLFAAVYVCVRLVRGSDGPARPDVPPAGVLEDTSAAVAEDTSAANLAAKYDYALDHAPPTAFPARKEERDDP
jgi:hypothetical protein